MTLKEIAINIARLTVAIIGIMIMWLAPRAATIPVKVSFWMPFWHRGQYCAIIFHDWRAGMACFAGFLVFVLGFVIAWVWQD